jgi:tetratricopeptide (TPR) repeat protein
MWQWTKQALALASTVALLLASLTPVLTTAAAAPTGESEAAQAGKKTTAALFRKIDDVSDNANETRTIVEVVLVPIGLLVAILAAGGILGVVFSVRDQRRVSQLHELTVGGEVASQRRSEQSFGSFFDQSQTTLALVNDTLRLAKEATDRAAHSMELKAKSRINAIEERAQKLMLDVFSLGEFELVVEDPVRRTELHTIADELRSLEGYLSLQDIPLPEYTKFVKAIDQFLLDDTESALQALRLSSQDQVVGDLQRFIEYWLGYMLTTVGEYDEAVGRFRHDELDLPEDDSEHFQLERIIAETEFFLLAKPIGRDGASGSEQSALGPRERFELMAKLLDRLAKLATKIVESEDRRARLHTTLEVARTRADIYEWIAYDERHLDDPIDAGEDDDAVDRAKAIIDRNPKPESAVKFVSSPPWNEMSDPDVFRAWALIQAQAICEEQPERNLDVDFALAECYFKLGDPHADSAFDRAEHALHHEFGEHREKRKSASLQQSLLICHSRLLKLRETNDEQRRAETRQVLQASRDAREAVNEMRQSRVTVFSQIQRRNVTQTEFKAEIGEIVDQDHLKPEDQ